MGLEQPAGMSHSADAMRSSREGNEAVCTEKSKSNQAVTNAKNMVNKRSSRQAACAATLVSGVLAVGAVGGVPTGVAAGLTTIRHAQADASLTERNRMVERQISARGVTDARVLSAMRSVPRHEFVPTELRQLAYSDTPLPIGYDQTISQPYIVAYMTEAVSLPNNAKVLDVGTGSGYQAAVLAGMTQSVYSIEIVPELAASAAARLEELGYDNVQVRYGDGYRGWPDEAPFDGIIVAAAPDHIPQALVEQLAIGARLVIPVGDRSQTMTIVTKTENGSTIDTTFPVRFVPMTGDAKRP